MFENTYWNNEGKYQEDYKTLVAKIPDSEQADSIHIELLRNISNCYYDHFNNRNCNWDHKKEQFLNIRYNRNRLVEAAKAEGEDLDYLLNSIQETIDKTLIEENCEAYYDDEYGGYYYCELTEQEENIIEESYEKLVNVIVRYAAKVDQE